MNGKSSTLAPLQELNTGSSCKKVVLFKAVPTIYGEKVSFLNNIY